MLAISYTLFLLPYHVFLGEDIVENYKVLNWSVCVCACVHVYTQACMCMTTKMRKKNTKHLDQPFKFVLLNIIFLSYLKICDCEELYLGWDTD